MQPVKAIIKPIAFHLIPSAIHVLSCLSTIFHMYHSYPLLLNVVYPNGAELLANSHLAALLVYSNSHIVTNVIY